MDIGTLGQVRRIALALPEVSERISHGATCFFVRDKTPLCYFHDNHRGDGRVSLWCPVATHLQEILVFTESEKFFKPATSSAGHFRDWVGVYLDTPDRLDWTEISMIVEQAYRNVAPKSLVARLDSSTTP